MPLGMMSDDKFLATGHVSNVRRDGSCQLEWFERDAAYKERYSSLQAALDAAEAAGLRFISRRLHGFTHTETLQASRSALLQDSK